MVPSPPLHHSSVASHPPACFLDPGETELFSLAEFEEPV
jgi:hypothetical protein